MHFTTSSAVILATLASNALAHGVVTSITGSNNVTMPGLSVIDGTPRDSPSPQSGAEQDTSIIRNNGGPLGETKGAGAVDAATAVAKFMGTGATAATRFRRGLLANLLSGGAAKSANAAGAQQQGGLLGGLLGKIGGQAAGAAPAAAQAQGTKTPPGTSETIVGQTAGKGATSGLPTVAANGIINMNFHQVNQDGAGPLQAAIDPTSGGTSEAAFVPAQMAADVPGLPVGGLSGTTTTDFPIQVQMPAGMTCNGTVAGVTGVCVVRVKNGALAGPFGGSAVFTQEAAAGAAANGTAAPAAAAAAPAAVAAPAAAAAAPAAAPAAGAAGAAGAGTTGALAKRFSA